MSKPMPAQQARVLISFLCAASVSACTFVSRYPGLGVAASPTPPTTLEASTGHLTAAPPPPSMTVTPGLLLRGSVRSSDEAALDGVEICRSFASYPGTRVAITGSNGEFAAEFVAIPGDEMIAIWPYLEGYSFDPPQVYWRHYHGFEASTLDFVASSLHPGANPSRPCQ